MHKYFRVPHYLRDGAKNLEEAEAMALRDAVQFRFELVKAGKIRKWGLGEIQSGVVGVKWRQEKKAWQVGLQINGQQINGGVCEAKDDSPEEIERARLIAVEKRRNLERQYFEVQVTVNDSLLLQQRDSGMAGITWERTIGAWIACSKGDSCFENHPTRSREASRKTDIEINRRFFPTDNTVEAIEKARQAAIIWLQWEQNAEANRVSLARKRKSSEFREPKKELTEAKEEINEAHEELGEPKEDIKEVTMAAAVGTSSAAEADAVAAALEASNASEAGLAVDDAAGNVPEAAGSVPEAGLAVDGTAGGVPEAGLAVGGVAGGVPEAGMAVDSAAGNAPETDMAVDSAAGDAPQADMAVDAAAGDLPEAMAVDTTAGGAIEAATTAVPPLEEPMTAAS